MTKLGWKPNWTLNWKPRWTLRGKLPRWARRLLAVAAVLVLIPVLVVVALVTWLWVEGSGTPSAAARGRGSDAIWLGHAWVDGRRTQADVDNFAARVRQTGIRDLFVHSGPLADDGSLDPALRPQARWLVGALHQALPGVRVQAWLGNVVGKDRLDPDSVATRDRIVAGAGQVLDDGFDGVHYDLEPMADGAPSYLTLLETTRELTRARNAVLSVAAHQLEPLSGFRIAGEWAIGKPHWWSTDYLHEVALRVDQVAIMAYDSGVLVERAYSGYVRVQTRLALTAVPNDVTLFIGVPAYHTDGPGHTEAETVAASVRGVRLALGDQPPDRPWGVSLYADFSATDGDWADYLAGWVRP